MGVTEVVRCVYCKHFFETHDERSTCDGRCNYWKRSANYSDHCSKWETMEDEHGKNDNKGVA